MLSESSWEKRVFSETFYNGKGHTYIDRSVVHVDMCTRIFFLGAFMCINVLLQLKLTIMIAALLVYYLRE